MVHITIPGFGSWTLQLVLDILNWCTVLTIYICSWTVEPAPGVDLEGLEVAKDCLAEVFSLSELPTSDRPEPNLLVNIFSSQEGTQNEAKSTHSEELHGGRSEHSSVDDGPSGASKVQVFLSVIYLQRMINSFTQTCPLLGNIYSGLSGGLILSEQFSRIATSPKKKNCGFKRL